MPPIFIAPMPTVNSPQAAAPGASAPGAPNQAPRPPFRPPWVKQGPEPLPMPTAPWTLARARDRRTSRDEPGQPADSAPAGASTRKQSKITIIPSQPGAVRENGTAEANKLCSEVVSTAANKSRQPPPATAVSAPERKLSIQAATKQSKQESAAGQAKDVLAQQPTERKIEIQIQSKQTPVPAPPMPPPPPPPTATAPATLQCSMNEQKAAQLEALRSRPRKRPDWGAMMKEVEGGKKLRHVQCNDRSTPLLPKVKVKETFMYESEKPNVHNRLLQEIQSGVHLRKVTCNDRSKPILDGLRKFRRQLTIEEQLQKASEETPVDAEPDELDDIDKVRDDLQSTKQMLALELRNREAVDRENKRLQARILNLEVELEKERLNRQQTEAPTMREKQEEKMSRQLHQQLQASQQQAEELEIKYQQAALQLEEVQAHLEEARKRNAALERKVGEKAHPLTKEPSAKKVADTKSVSVPAPDEEDTEYEEEEETESEDVEDSSEDEEKAAALREKRIARELRMLNTKVYSLKEKEDMARKERRALKLQLKNQQEALRQERKKYRELQKEVDKMSKLMNEEDEQEEDEDEESEEEEETEESSSEESEEEDSEGDLPPDALAEARRQNYTARAKRHENILSALKKGNYLLKANVDKLMDDLHKQKEMAVSLQEDLNAVLAELG